MTTKLAEAPFKIGDRVTTAFFDSDRTVVRKITEVQQRVNCQSGWVAKADGGERCPHCARAADGIPDWIDSSWFKPA